MTNSLDNTVSVIDLATNTVIGSPIAVGYRPSDVAITPGPTLTPTAHVGLLKTTVADLLAAGSLNQKQASALTTRLDQAFAHLVAGDTREAIRRLKAFVNQVNLLIREGVLTPAEGQPLLYNANAAISLLRR